MCLWCSAPATRLCDAVIGAPVLPSRELWTCDAPLCDACSYERTRVVFCGQDPGVDSIDECPEHKGLSMSETLVCASESDAVALRRRMRIRLARRISVPKVRDE